MKKQFFLPESMCKIDSKMSYKKIKTFYKNKSSITGKVLRLNSKDNLFEVDLGGNLIGILPIEESTIYQIYKPERKFSYSVITLVGKVIQAKIFSLKNKQIILSRKANMLEALENIKPKKEIQFASITSFSQTSAFIDLGAGIIGKSTTYNLSPVIFNHASEIGLKKGDIIPVKITDFQSSINCFDISVVDATPDYKDALNEEDIVLCKIYGDVGDNLGYYVLINNKYAGIVDSPSHKLQYGDEISAHISKISAKGPRLKFVEKIWFKH